MSSIFGGGKQPSSPAPAYVPAPVYEPPPVAPVDNTAEVDAAREKERLRAAAAQGRGATFLTSGLGLLTEAPIEKKKLGGSK